MRIKKTIYIEKTYEQGIHSFKIVKNSQKLIKYKANIVNGEFINEIIRYYDHSIDFYNHPFHGLSNEAGFHPHFLMERNNPKERAIFETQVINHIVLRRETWREYPLEQPKISALTNLFNYMDRTDKLYPNYQHPITDRYFEAPIKFLYEFLCKKYPNAYCQIQSNTTDTT